MFSCFGRQKGNYQTIDRGGGALVLDDCCLMVRPNNQLNSGVDSGGGVEEEMRTGGTRGVLDRLGPTKSAETYEKEMTGQKPLTSKQTYSDRQQYVKANNRLA